MGHLKWLLLKRQAKLDRLKEKHNFILKAYTIMQKLDFTFCSWLIKTFRHMLNDLRFHLLKITNMSNFSHITHERCFYSTLLSNRLYSCPSEYQENLLRESTKAEAG